MGARSTEDESMERNPPCPRCGGHASRNGLLKELKAECQKYVCTECGRSFSTFTNTLFFEDKTPPRVVAAGVELNVQCGLSLRETSRVVRNLLGVVVAYTTVRDWARQYGNLGELPVEKTVFTNVWHVDEMFVKRVERLPSGKHKFDYVWIVSDSKQQFIAAHVSKKRDAEAAKTVLEKAKATAGFSPRVLVSDGYDVYPKATHCVFGRKTLHVVAHFQADQFLWQGEAWSLSNNPAESLNSRIRNRLRRLRGIKTLEFAQRWLDSLQTIWNNRLTQSLALALLNSINA